MSPLPRLESVLWRRRERASGNAKSLDFARDDSAEKGLLANFLTAGQCFSAFFLVASGLDSDLDSDFESDLDLSSFFAEDVSLGGAELFLA
jgi:hypothetical protein